MSMQKAARSMRSMSTKYCWKECGKNGINLKVKCLKVASIRTVDNCNGSHPFDLFSFLALGI